MPVTAPRMLALLVVVGAIALVAAPGPAAGQSTVTFVDSNISADTTWSAAESPYRVVSNVSVAPDATLTIEPGTTVEFAEGVTLDVAGSLRANGTSESPITITASRALSTPGAWGSIRTTGTDTATVSLTHTELSYATTGVTVSNSDSMVQFLNVSLNQLAKSGIDVKTAAGDTTIDVRESRFQDLDGTGIAAARTDILPVETASDWDIRDTTFEAVAEAGIYLDTRRTTGLTVRGNHFEGIDGPAVRIAADRVRATSIRSNRVVTSDQALVVETADASSLSVVKNEIEVTGTALDIALEGNVHALEFHNNRIEGGQTGLSITHDPRSGGYFSFDLSVTDNEIRNQSRTGFGLRTSLFSDSEIGVRNNTVADNGRDGVSLSVGGFRNAVIADNRLTDNGRNGLSMIARHVRNSRIERNVIRENGAAGVELTARQVMERVSVTGNELLDNAGEGLAISNGEPTDSNYTVTDNVVAANAYGIALAGPQTGQLTKNAVVYNTVTIGETDDRSDADTGIGVLVTAGATDIELATNDIYGNRVGLQTDINGTVSAVTNYWGAESGPYHRSINPEGAGNAVLTTQGWVDFVEVRAERVTEAYFRPTATVTVDPQTVNEAQPVTVSAAGSSDPDGEVRNYRFTIAGQSTVTHQAGQTVSFEDVGTYPVALWVEDDMGIESSDPATASVQVLAAPETTTAPETTIAPETTTPGTKTPRPTTEIPVTIPQPVDGDPGLVGWFGGLLGAVFFGTALVFGGRGMYQTFTGLPLTVRGRRIHALAGIGVAIWAVSTIFGPPVFGLVAGIGLGAWIGLTGLAYLLVRFR
ncbi:right-handed parallel beta-helix repeat-containing protein [Halodesulfurarchaeum sp.]|uniref:right-handed parallel beta-helix repeat-containing protein n=1 Tax=Halodesulfurarchaeum sp. TaxID=1980530 RepID=UPI002FC28DF1